MSRPYADRHLTGGRSSASSSENRRERIRKRTPSGASSAGGTPSDLLEFAKILPFDEEILERAIERTQPTDPSHHEATARLSLARRL